MRNSLLRLAFPDKAEKRFALEVQQFLLGDGRRMGEQSSGHDRRKLSTDQVKLKIIGSGVGAVTENDVLLASASGAIIIAFGIRPDRKAPTF